MPYMNVTEVESAIIALSAAHPSICELITLPNLTIEGRTVHAVRLGTRPENTVDAYYLTGGVHAREWGSCEILVNLATDLCDAYALGSGIGYGGKIFAAAEVRALMEQINILIFPCVNPDGRNFSQTTSGLWRKNRDTADSGGVASKIGIDINRNQDFLWDFNTAFDPGAVNGYLASTDPSSDTYHGHAPHSEPETRNINYIHDTYTRIKWYIDVHSYSEDILFVWGDDETQVTDPNMNFTNPVFNHKRGLLGGAYGEFAPDGDLSALIGLANAFTKSLAEVREKIYVAKPGFSLYATSGTNDDYAYSRHIADQSKSKSLSFTVEWGTEFQPVWTEMQEIIKDVSAGLIGLGLEAVGIDSFIVANRDTFSSHEVETTLSYEDAFYVIYDGFSPNALGLPGAVPTIRFRESINGGIIGSISATATSVTVEDPGAPNTPQRMLFTFRVDFVNSGAFTAETRDIFLHASLVGRQDIAVVHLIKQPNPYMVDGPISWLSTDVRVFQLRPGQKVNGFSGVTLGNPDSDPNASFNYIQGLLGELRGFGNNPAPPFENITQNEQASQLELSRTVGGVRVLNFAVAKVRFRANTQDAVDVRVFFRAFNTMVSDLSYTTIAGADVQNSRRTADGKIPLLGTNRFFGGAGTQILSIPYFAERRIDSSTQSMTAQNDNWNTQTLFHAGGQEAHQYFGCWLDFNQTDPQFPPSLSSASYGPFTGRVPILQLVRGIHQCLVAEVRYQPGAVDPISRGATPSSSDRLAQRNLAIVESDNPGIESTHIVQHTVLIKPSKAILLRQPTLAATQGDPRSHYDELVIRWNDIPRDTVATLYAPDWNADEILELASLLRPGPQLLSRVDGNTIGCPVRDISYIPIPGRALQPMPALLTLRMPLSVRDGEEFKVDVQQHSGLTFRTTLPGRIDFESSRRGNRDFDFSTRKVLGAFRVTVAVKIGDPLLHKAVRNLAVLRYILDAIPATDSWHPVFVRYIGQLSDQVSGLGVDPTQIGPSPDDPSVPGRPPDGKLDCHTGKVSEVIFDCFGDFEGFTLDTCGECLPFRTKEKGIGELVLRACKERLLISVCVTGGRSKEIREIIVRSGDCQRVTH
jgi:murein tripeptide amidase MpaA